MNPFSTTSAAWVLAAAMVAASPAAAQDAGTQAGATTPARATAQAEAAPAEGDQTGNDIIVTAQRRAQRLQDVPISITALTSNELSSQGITSTHDIAQSVTGLTITESGGYVQPFIRGVGSTVTNLGEPGSAATYIDGVYMPTVNGQLYELANLDSIQVLKGPQGTLFGRNANTGAIIITTRQPSYEPAGTFTASYGNFNALKFNGFATTGLTSNIAVSLAGNYDSHDGWFHNLNPANGFGARVGDAERWTLRGTILIEPTSNLKITLSGDGMHGDDASPILIQPINGYQGYLPGGLKINGPYDFIGNEHVGYLTGQYGGSGRVNWDAGSGIAVTSTTAWRHYLSRSVAYDSDTTPTRFVAISNRDVGSNFTQEVLVNSTGKGAFTWVVGGFYLRQDGKLDPLRTFTPGMSDLTVQQVTEAFAGFADATLRFGALEVTGGLRYSTETKTISGQRNGAVIVTGAKHTWNAATPRVVLAYHPSSDAMIYASFSQGFKSGAYNANALSATPVPINPEKVDAYEAGLKFSPMPGVTINGSVFHYITSDLQVQALNPSTNLIELRNAAKVRSNGGDLDITYRPVRDLSLKLGVSYLNAVFTSFPAAQVYLPVAGSDGRNASTILNVTGKRNVRSPDWTVNFAADYKIHVGEGSVVPSFNAYYSSKFYWTVDNRIVEPAHFVANASITWNLPGDRFSVAIWGRNITDEVRFRNVSASGQADRRAADEPALYGVRLGYKF
jgi:iron complex outermembrane receptor protein